MYCPTSGLSLDDNHMRYSAYYMQYQQSIYSSYTQYYSNHTLLNDVTILIHTRNTAITILLWPDCIATVATHVSLRWLGDTPCCRTRGSAGGFSSSSSMAAPFSAKMQDPLLRLPFHQRLYLVSNRQLSRASENSSTGSPVYPNCWQIDWIPPDLTH